MSSRFLLGVACVSLLTLSGISIAQTITTGRESKKADVNFTELANYYKEHPLPLVRKMPFDEEEEQQTRHFHKAPPANQVHLHVKAPGSTTLTDPYSHLPNLPSSPIPNSTFLSTTSPGTAIPPDTHGGVDSQYCVTAINTTIHIQTRTGGNILANNLDGFWSSVLPAGTGTFDPRIHYDPYYKKWILVTDAVANTTMGQSTLLIGVTVTNDPTGAWHLYAVPVDPTDASWLDFPNVGFNNRWITITGNMFPNTSGGASGAVVYVFRYDSIMAGVSAPYTKISKSSSFAICPAVTYDFSESNMFCVETWNPGMGQLRLWKISGSTGAPTMSSVGYPANTQHWHANGGSSNFGPQLGGGTTQKIDLGDDRITSCMFRNGKLWTCHNAFLPSPGTANRASVMWWQLDTMANPLQVGMINDPSAVNFYDYPSIAANRFDDALIGLGTFSSAIHPSAAYAWRLHTDPVDSIRPAYTYKPGDGLYYTTFGGSRNRWGDYSATAIDPRNDEDFWTIQEASTTAATVNWDTWWANVQICPKPAAPTLFFTGAQPCPGDTMSYVINPVPGALSYTWSVSGAGWIGSSTSTAITLTAGTVRDTVTVYATNACGQGESLTLNVSPKALPPTPFISVITPPCTGVSTAVFSASSPGATAYFWQLIGTGWTGTSSSSALTATVGSGPVDVVCAGINACGVGPTDTLRVYPGNPPANFTVTTHITMTNVNITTTFAGTPLAGAIYTWNFSGGVAIPGAGIGPHSVHWTTPGTKTVTLTVDYYGCVTTYSDTVHVNQNVGLTQVTAPGDNVQIVPNPNEGIFDIVFDEAYATQIGVTITDVSGKTVYSSEFSGTTNNKVPLKVDFLPSGVYAVNIKVDGHSITKKISVSK